MYNRKKRTEGEREEKGKGRSRYIHIGHIQSVAKLGHDEQSSKHSHVYTLYSLELLVGFHQVVYKCLLVVTFG